MKDEIVVRLTRRQAAKVEIILETTACACEEPALSKTLREALKRINDAFKRSHGPTKH